MHLNSRILVLVLLACAAGCAKPVAPVARNPEGESGSAPSLAAGDASSHAFRARLTFVGSTVTLDAAYNPVVQRDARFYIYSSGEAGANPDTVPAYSRLTRIEWRPVHPRGANSPTGSALLESVIEAPPPFEGAAAPDSGHVFAPGNHEITLQAPPRAGGGRVTVRFVVGFVPTSWWAGPDPSLWPRSSDGDGRGVDVTVWRRFATNPAWPPDGRRYFGPDSFRFVPSKRLPVRGNAERRTFYEIFGDRIYARAEGDSVHLNSWVVLCNGGYDKDSPYLPLVEANDPGLPADLAGNPNSYPVLLPQGLNGSPIGFRSRVVVRLANGNLIRPSSSTTYPNFQSSSPFRNPALAGYWPMNFAGKAYAAVQAVDSHGMPQPFIFDPAALADLVDGGGGTPEQRLQRRSIVTFYVRPAPAP